MAGSGLTEHDRRGLIHAGAAILFGLVLILLGAAVAPSGATSSTGQRGSESTHEVPDWMNRVCAAEDSVNCWFDGGTYGDTGPIFIRKMPHTLRNGRYTVCVLFADHPRRDYCERRR